METAASLVMHWALGPLTVIALKKFEHLSPTTSQDLAVGGDSVEKLNKYFATACLVINLDNTELYVVASVLKLLVQVLRAVLKRIVELHVVLDSPLTVS